MTLSIHADISLVFPGCMVSTYGVTASDLVVLPIGEGLDRLVAAANVDLPPMPPELLPLSKPHFHSGLRLSLGEALSRCADLEGHVLIRLVVDGVSATRGSMHVMYRERYYATSSDFEFDTPDALVAGIHRVGSKLRNYTYQARLLRDYMPIEGVAAAWGLSAQGVLARVATSGAGVKSIKVGGVRLFDVSGLCLAGPYIERSGRWGMHGVVPIESVMSRKSIADRFGVHTNNVSRLVEAGSVVRVPVTSGKSLYYIKEGQNAQS